MPLPFESAPFFAEGSKNIVDGRVALPLRTGLRKALQWPQAKQKFDVNDVAAGREYVKAYVEYIHFVERLYESSSNPAAGHFGETEHR